MQALSSLSPNDSDQRVWDSMWVTFDKPLDDNAEQGGVPAQQAVQLAASVVEQQQQMFHQILAQQNEMILKATLGIGRATGAGGPAEGRLLEELAALKAKIAAFEGGSGLDPDYSISSPTSLIDSVPSYDAVAVVRNRSGGGESGGAIDQRAVLEHELKTEKRRALDLDARIQARNRRLANELQSLKRKNAQLEVDYAASAGGGRSAVETPGYETAADHKVVTGEEPIYATSRPSETPDVATMPVFKQMADKVKRLEKQKAEQELRAQQNAKAKADRVNAALKAKRDSEAALQSKADQEAMMRERRVRREERETAKLLRDAAERTSTQQRRNMTSPNKHSTGMQPEKDFRFSLTTPLRSTNSRHAHDKQEIYGVARHAREPRKHSHRVGKTKHVIDMLHGPGAESPGAPAAEVPTVEEEEF